MKSLFMMKSLDEETGGEEKDWKWSSCSAFGVAAVRSDRCLERFEITHPIQKRRELLFVKLCLNALSVENLRMPQSSASTV